MKRVVPFLLLALMWSSSALSAVKDCMNIDAPGWQTSSSQRTLYRKLVEYMSCPSDDPESGKLADRVACNYFVGKTLNDLYDISDFSTGNGRWLLANDIHRYVSKGNGEWSLLGTADEQSVLNDAASGAGNGHAVIAVTSGAPGHVALILPGTPKASTTWSGLRAPNSAAFSLDDVDKAYVFCRLSYGFSEPKKVQIFWRTKK